MKLAYFLGLTESAVIELAVREKYESTFGKREKDDVMPPPNAEFK